MSGGFDLANYVTVDERIEQFYAKYPEGSLQGEWTYIEGIGITYKAYAYRTADDRRPGVGHASEPVPGMTPYTKGSELANCETSAWGRAIVALGIGAKKGIASANEVRNRTGGVAAPVDSPVAAAPVPGAGQSPATAAPIPPGAPPAVQAAIPKADLNNRPAAGPAATPQHVTAEAKGLLKAALVAMDKTEREGWLDRWELPSFTTPKAVDSLPDPKLAAMLSDLKVPA